MTRGISVTPRPKPSRNHRYADHMARRFAPPSTDEVTNLLRGVIDPELGSDVVELGMARCLDITDDGRVTIEVKLTIGGCPLRAQIKKDIETRVATHPGVFAVRIEWGEMNADERSATMAKARWNARERATETAVPATTRVLATLTPREERVLRMRFGIGMNTDHTLEEVGKQFDVTRERIRQIEAKALRKLRHPSRSERLKSFLDQEG